VVVAAVRHGLLSFDEATKRYAPTPKYLLGMLR
jgi:hypothetical protein